MTGWDFAAEVDALVGRVRDPRGPESMADLLARAHDVVERAGPDAEAVRDWLVAHAELLVAQQLLVASVHARGDEADRLPEVLRAWAAARAERPSAADAVEWLRSEHPGLLRAWLLSRVEALVAAELEAGTP